jgi:hypothetical protein
MKVSRKGMKRGVKQTRVVLPPSRKGRNKRGVCAHKRTRPTQTPSNAEMLQTGYAPRPVTAYAMSLAKARGTRKDRA